MRFRLANLFYLTAVVAIAVFAWDLFIRENVAWVSVDERGIRFWMTDDWYAWMGQAHFHDETGELVDPYHTLAQAEVVMLTRPTHGFSWKEMWPFVLSVVAAEVALHVVFRSVRRWRNGSQIDRNAQHGVGLP